MNHKLLLALAASLPLLGCGSGSTTDEENSSHTDTASAIIDDSNALAIAAAVYRVTAVDVPFTADLAMDDNGAVNTAACSSGGVIGGDADMMSGEMGMDMSFSDCTLSGSPSSHALTVNGSCNNSDGDTAGIENVKGERISFTTEQTLALHNFYITRSNGNMTRARGALHLDNGDTVKFTTPTAFAGTATTPTAGVLEIAGASDSRLRISVVDGGATDGAPAGTNFTLEIDTGDGNGYGAPVAYDWSNDFWLALAAPR